MRKIFCSKCKALNLPTGLKLRKGVCIGSGCTKVFPKFASKRGTKGEGK